MSVPLWAPSEGGKDLAGEAFDMRVKSLVLASASLTILALAASPAFAQGGTPGNDQPAGGIVAQPGNAATSGTPDAAGEETVVVTGLRRSLQSAQNLKRNSIQQIDAIVASDIGKLPDIAVSDTAARIPGVQVDRGGGE